MNGSYPPVGIRTLANRENSLLVSEATQLRPCDDKVLVTLPATGTFVIKLPPVAEAPWAKFYIEVIADPGTGTASIDDAGDVSFTEASVLDSVGDFYVVENFAGRKWHVVTKQAT